MPQRLQPRKPPLYDSRIDGTSLFDDADTGVRRVLEVIRKESAATKSLFLTPFLKSENRKPSSCAVALTNIPDLANVETDLVNDPNLFDDELVKSIGGMPPYLAEKELPNLDGPGAQKIFWWKGVAVDLGGRAKFRYPLLKALWDEKKRCPREERSYAKVQSEVYGEGEYADGFRALYSEINMLFLQCGVNLRITKSSDKIWLKEI